MAHSYDYVHEKQIKNAEEQQTLKTTKIFNFITFYVH